MKSLINEYLIFFFIFGTSKRFGEHFRRKMIRKSGHIATRHLSTTMIFTIHDTKLTVKHQEYKLFSFFLRLNARYEKARKETGYDDHFRVDEGISTPKNSPISPLKKSLKIG